MRITVPPIRYTGRLEVDCAVLGVEPSSELRRDLALPWIMELTLAPRLNGGVVSPVGESMALDNVRGR